MKYICIDEEYLKLLRSAETRIPFQDYGEYKYKPFISPLFKINGLTYVTHLTHYKPEKHLSISESSNTMFIIKDVRDNPVSVINFTGMFPVPEEAIIELNFSNIDKMRKFTSNVDQVKFEKFLDIQMKSIHKNRIAEKAKTVYARKSVFGEFLNSVDFIKLEKIAREWQVEKRIEQNFILMKGRIFR